MSRSLGPVLTAVALSALACSGAQRPQNTAAVGYRFQCAQRDARIIVDEVDQGACMLWETQYLGLSAGTHRLRVEREGFLPLEQELPAGGRRQTVRLQLREVPE
jgi:hypothetical protein